MVGRVTLSDRIMTIAMDEVVDGQGRGGGSPPVPLYLHQYKPPKLKDISTLGKMGSVTYERHGRWHRCELPVNSPHFKKMW